MGIIMIKPTLDEAKKIAKGCTIIPIATEIFSDSKTPIEVLKNLRRSSANWYILESVNGGDSWGRYTFLGYNPVTEIYGTGSTVTVKESTVKTIENAKSVEILRDMITRYKSPRLSDLPPFTGGFVGYFSYDFVQNFIPKLELKAQDKEGFQDFHLMMIGKVIAFDQLKQKIYLIVNISTEENFEDNYNKGVKELENMKKIISISADSVDKNPSKCGSFSPTFTETEFVKMVDKVKNHIKQGDIFQTVISNRFIAPFQGNLMNTYRMLRTINPSPYMVYMKLGDVEIACSSPELLVSLQNGKVSTFPLAGTCPKGKTDAEDVELTERLLNDEKELAEHDMLVDLARNDIGKVCKFGSVAIKEYRQIKRFSHVSHIGSHVIGKLKEDMNPIDVLAAAFPAGTLSGAPKKRACEIIDGTENLKRGPYGGAIGYIDFAGNMDVCIGIRMAVLKNDHVFVQSGAGIVADSIPENEYKETRNKAQAIINALESSEDLE